MTLGGSTPALTKDDDQKPVVSADVLRKQLNRAITTIEELEIKLRVQRGSVLGKDLQKELEAQQAHRSQLEAVLQAGVRHRAGRACRHWLCAQSGSQV